VAKPAPQKTGGHLQNAHWLCPAGAFLRLRNKFSRHGTNPALALYESAGGLDMRVERGLRLMNAELVGEAYAIAANYLRKRGAIPDNLATNEQLLEIIVKLFHRGELNKIRLANKAIAEFEAVTLIA